MQIIIWPWLKSPRSHYQCSFSHGPAQALYLSARRFFALAYIHPVSASLPFSFQNCCAIHRSPRQNPNPAAARRNSFSTIALVPTPSIPAISRALKTPGRNAKSDMAPSHERPSTSEGVFSACSGQANFDDDDNDDDEIENEERAHSSPKKVFVLSPVF